MENVTATLENSLAILHKVKHRVNTWPGNSTPMYTAKRKNYEFYKNLSTNVYSSIIYNSQKVETSQMSTN